MASDGTPAAAQRPAPVRVVVRGLALACHPVPTAVVTTIVTVLAVSVGNDHTTCILVAAAVLAGQLSIGWSNDAIDVARDVAAHRADKPVATGVLPRRTVWVACLVATLAALPLSFALGWRAGLINVLVMAGGWAHNVGVKGTAWSPVPFFVAFGALPAVATFALPDHPAPPWWAMVASGLIGVAAHFGNVLPDLEVDAGAGIRGLPNRIGAFASAVVATGLALLAVVVAAVWADAPALLTGCALGLAVVLSVTSFAAVRRSPRSEAAFYCAMAIAAVGVVLVANSDHLT